MTTISVKSILEGFPGQRLLVVGDIMLDENLWGNVRRVSPEAPVPVVELQRQTYVPGGAANTAANATGLKGVAILGGVVGQDQSAVRLRDCLRERGVDASGLVVDPNRPTTTKTRVVVQSQQVVRIDREVHDPVPFEIEDKLLAWAAREMEGVDACVISDYAKGVVSPRVARELIAIARRRSVPVVVDPKGYDYGRYRGATVVTPNLHEAEQAARLSVRSGADLDAVGLRLLEELPGSAVLITRGAAGMSLFVASEEAAHIAAEAQAVFDVTGAGDTASATLAIALAAGAPLRLAMRLANRAAGVVVANVGTSSITLAQLRRAHPRNRHGTTRARTTRERGRG